MFDKAKYLAAASAVEYAVQLLVPVYLVRTLSHEEFASYRFMWLLAGTLTTTLLLGFPASLYYFVPRIAAERQFGYVAQTAAFSALLGVVACAALLGVATAWPGLDMLQLLPQPLGAFFAFLILVAATSLLDYLPAARAEVKAQAAFNLGNALWRAACIVAGAWIGSIAAVCWALLVYAIGRFALQALYVARSMPLRDGGFDRLRFRTQFVYAAPFGLASAFWALRSQAEQWVGAALLAPRAYASLSIAGSITPIAMLVHQAITASSVSAINRLESQGDVTGMTQINARANVLSASYLFPVLTFFFVTSGPLFRLIYTASYADAALVTKLLCIGFVASAIEVSTLTNALRMRRAVLLFDGSMLCVSLAASVAGGLVFGLVGVVIGSVISGYVSTAYFVAVLVRRTGVPLARFQHWGELARYFAAACLAGAIGWMALEWAAAQFGLFGQIAIATTAMVLAYVPLVRLLGLSLFGFAHGVVIGAPAGKPFS
jgi:O-antigen/teichoic acid export membrane protein